MSVVDPELFKKHTRTDDFECDDEYLQYLLDTAETQVVRSTGRSMEELVSMGGGRFPLPLVHAIMLLGAHWYNQRESVSQAVMSPVPDALQNLVLPYRKISGV